MARIRAISTGTDTNSVHPTEVDCEVRKVVTPEGEVLMQISTFGSDQRISTPKVSQTIQFNRSQAIDLSHLIQGLFNYN